MHPDHIESDRKVGCGCQGHSTEVDGYHPHDGEVHPDFQEVVEGFGLILSGLGMDLSSPHVKDTPERAARAWFDELAAGQTSPQDGPDVTTFPQEGDGGMIILRGIPVKSLCSHHLLPFIGEAVVAYIPGNGEIVGLSKLSRITNYWARRPQVQERLTGQIADDLWSRVKPEFDAKDVQFEPTGPTGPYTADFSSEVTLGIENQGGVGVLIRARHMCMELRGVEHRGEMVTSQLRGVFKSQDETRAEFLKLAMEDD